MLRRWTGHTAVEGGPGDGLVGLWLTVVASYGGFRQQLETHAKQVKL